MRMDPTPAGADAPGMSSAPSSPREVTLVDVEIGRRVKRLRVQRGTSQRDIAAMLRITSAQMHRYEAGKTRISAGRLVQIAEILATSISALTGTRAAEPGRQTGYDIEEQRLIDAYRSISDPARRAAVFTVVKGVSSADQPSAAAEG